MSLGGPGEVGERGELSDLMERIHRLELVARHNVAGLRPGDYQTAIRGRGLIFHETRKYVMGEPARHIDWNITARVGEPHVKVFLEERRREIFICLDVSPSMAFGSRRRTKLELAVELAASLAVSAQQAGDQLGYVLFADRVLAESRPRGGGKQLFRALRAMLENVGPWDRAVEASDPRVAIHSIQRHRGRFVVFFISDFIDHDFPEDLKYLKAQHDLSLLHVYDPLEFAFDAPLSVRARSPEGPEKVGFSKPAAMGDLQAMNAFLAEQAGRYRAAVQSFSTEDDVRMGLERFFHRKRRLLVG